MNKVNETELTISVNSVAFLFRLRQPPLEFLKRYGTVVALLLFLSGFLAPEFEGIVIDAPSLDASKTLLVLSAVNFKDWIVRLFLRPLPESTDLTTDFLSLGDRPLAILCADSHHLWEPTTAVLAAADSDVTLYASSQRVVNHVRNAGGV